MSEDLIDLGQVKLSEEGELKLAELNAANEATSGAGLPRVILAECVVQVPEAILKIERDLGFIMSNDGVREFLRQRSMTPVDLTMPADRIAPGLPREPIPEGEVFPSLVPELLVVLEGQGAAPSSSLIGRDGDVSVTFDRRSAGVLLRLLASAKLWDESHGPDPERSIPGMRDLRGIVSIRPLTIGHAASEVNRDDAAALEAKIGIDRK